MPLLNLRNSLVLNLLLIIAVIVLLWRSCGHECPPCVTGETKTTTTYKSDSSTVYGVPTYIGPTGSYTDWDSIQIGKLPPKRVPAFKITQPRFTITGSKSGTLVLNDSVAITEKVAPAQDVYHISKQDTGRRPMGKIADEDLTQLIWSSDTALIWKDYFRSYHYKRTIKTKYGTVDIYDTVSRNEITGYRADANFRIPEITKETQVQERPKAKFMKGAGVMIYRQPLGSVNLHSAGFELGLLTKKLRLHEVGVYKNLRDPGWYFRGGIKF